jgi:hypothetical protein
VSAAKVHPVPNLPDIPPGVNEKPLASRTWLTGGGARRTCPVAVPLVVSAGEDEYLKRKGWPARGGAAARGQAGQMMARQFDYRKEHLRQSLEASST